MLNKTVDEIPVKGVADHAHLTLDILWGNRVQIPEPEYGSGFQARMGKVRMIVSDCYIQVRIFIPGASVHLCQESLQVLEIATSGTLAPLGLTKSKEAGSIPFTA
jgi:hypothetical protein